MAVLILIFLSCLYKLCFSNYEFRMCPVERMLKNLNIHRKVGSGILSLHCNYYCMLQNSAVFWYFTFTTLLWLSYAIVKIRFFLTEFQ